MDGRILNILRLYKSLSERIEQRRGQKSLDLKTAYLSQKDLLTSLIEMILKELQRKDTNRSSEGFCILCGTEFPTLPTDQKSCPICNTPYPPARYENEETVEITIEELRILTLWAESHSSFSKNLDQEILYSIVNRLKRQIIHSDITLTMQDEFIKMRKEGKKYITNHPAGDMP